MPYAKVYRAPDFQRPSPAEDALKAGKNRQAKNWVFCVNNYTAADEYVLHKMCLDEDVKYMVYGYEICPSTGTPHLQGHMQCVNESGMYYNTLRSKLRCYWGVTKGKPHQADKYARGLSHGKSPNTCWEFGVIDLGEDHPPNNPNGNPGNAGNPNASGPTMQQRMERNKRLRSETMSDLCDTGEISVMQVRGLKNARMDLREEVRSSSAPCTISGDMDNYWFWGPSGTGKSMEARRRWPMFFYKNCNKWWCGYDGQATIMVEDFDKNHACLCHHLKIWADRYPFTAEVKQGSTGTIRPARIVITSNYHPRDIWPDAGDLEPILRRFNVVHFDRNFNIPAALPSAFAETFNVPEDEHEDNGPLALEDLETECAPTLLYVPPTAAVPAADDSAQECDEDPDTQSESDSESDTDDENDFDFNPGAGAYQLLAAAVGDLLAESDTDDDGDLLDEFLDNCSPFTYEEGTIDLTQEE
jgi:hypothetical protein